MNNYSQTIPQEAVFLGEHYFAWLFAICAGVLGVLGWLEGLGIVNMVSVSGNNLQDGIIFLLPAITMAVLAFSFHGITHHRAGLKSMSTGERGLWATEHTLAYLFVAGTIGLGIIGMLTGFSVFGDARPEADGFIWELCALGGSVLATAFHMVGHHELVAEENYLASMVQRRADTVGTTVAPGTREYTVPR